MQHKRLMEWFLQWNSQLAIAETPFDSLKQFWFFFTKRAVQICRPQPFLWRQRQLFVTLAIGSIVLFVGNLPVFFVLAILAG